MKDLPSVTWWFTMDLPSITQWFELTFFSRWMITSEQVYKDGLVYQNPAERKLMRWAWWLGDSGVNIWITLHSDMLLFDLQIFIKTVVADHTVHFHCFFFLTMRFLFCGLFLPVWKHPLLVSPALQSHSMEGCSSHYIHAVSANLITEPTLSR